MGTPRSRRDDRLLNEKRKNGKESRIFFLGFDVGTTGLKALLVDCDGHVVAQAYREYPLFYPCPGWAEQDPEDWWRALCETSQEIFSKVQISSKDVYGMSISSQGSTFVFVDKNGRPLRNAVTWLDQRAVADAVTSEEGKIFRITGLQPYPGWTGTVLHWFYKNEPEVLKKTWRILLVGDYLGLRLTGETYTDYSSAARTRLFDLHNLDWSEELLARSGVIREQLPRLGPSGFVFGKVTEEASHQTGLGKGTPVALGGFDQSCCLLGAGAIRKGILMVSLGTATMVCTTVFEPVVDRECRLTTSCHTLPGAWVLQAPIMTSGALLRWWRDHFFVGPTENAYRKMDELAAQITPGAEGLIVLPYFSGRGAPAWDMDARGVVWGLTLAHEQAHFIRAILEGVSMEIRANVRVLEELGCPIDSVRVVGGGAKSVLWRNIIADVLGKRQGVVGCAEVGALGAAILAARGACVFRTIEDAVDAMSPTVEDVDFSQENHKRYEAVWKTYCEIADKFSNGNTLFHVKSIEFKGANV